MFLIGTIINFFGVITGNLFIRFIFTIKPNYYNIDIDSMSILVFIAAELMLMYFISKHYEIKEGE